MRSKDSLDDVVIARAPAEIAFKFMPDCFLIEAVAIAFDNADRAHHHAGGAETALKSMIFAECFLHWMQCVAVGETFDRRHVGTFGLTRQQSAGFYRQAVYMNGAGAALTCVTTDMSAGHAETFTQILN